MPKEELVAVLTCESEKLNRALDEMGHTLPDEGRNHVRERCRSIEAEFEETLGHAETMLIFCARTLPPQLGTAMRGRYDPHPEIDRFCTAGLESERVGSRGQEFSDREFMDRKDRSRPLTVAATIEAGFAMAALVTP